MKKLIQCKAILALIFTFWFQPILWIVRPYPLHTQLLCTPSDHLCHNKLLGTWRRRYFVPLNHSERRSETNLDYSKMCICLPSETSTRHLKPLSWERYLHSTRMVQKCIVVEISHKLLLNVFKNDMLWILQLTVLTITMILNAGIITFCRCRNYNFLQLYRFQIFAFIFLI